MTFLFLYISVINGLYYSNSVRVSYYIMDCFDVFPYFVQFFTHDNFNLQLKPNENMVLFVQYILTSVNYLLMRSIRSSVSNMQVLR